MMALALACVVSQGLHAQPFGAPAPALRGAPTAPPAYRAVNWETLVAPGWNAYQGVSRTDIGAMSDGDPRATALLKQLRAAWDKAPVNMALVGQPVRIAGYVVPLDQARDAVSEFLLVPTYGACIHTPPPPSNQIIHVVPRSPAKGIRSMDTVWIKGVLRYVVNDSGLGVSSWRVEAVDVEPYGDGGLQTVPLR